MKASEWINNPGMVFDIPVEKERIPCDECDGSGRLYCHGSIYYASTGEAIGQDPPENMGPCNVCYGNGIVERIIK